ncbi:hypothetical protein [Vibrio owensii]|uniref:hypothetical protein n=1 Tax=Vibrio owensii TaxID=696485 RepID=UPI003CC638D2
MHKLSTTAKLFNLHEVAAKLQVPFSSLLTGELEIPVINTGLWNVNAIVDVKRTKAKGTFFECKLVASMYGPRGAFLKKEVVTDLESLNSFIEGHMMALADCKKVVFDIDSSVRASRMGQPEGEAQFHGLRIDNITVHHIKIDKEFVSTGYVRSCDYEEFTKIPGILIVETMESDIKVEEVEQKSLNKYAITTIDSDYNEDSAIITTDKELDGLDVQELAETLGDLMLISEDDRVVVVNLGSTEELTL